MAEDLKNLEEACEYTHEILLDKFNTDFLFKRWLHTGDLKSLNNCLIHFEKYELYEHCAMIRDVIKDKINNGKEDNNI